MVKLCKANGSIKEEDLEEHLTLRKHRKAGLLARQPGQGWVHWHVGLQIGMGHRPKAVQVLLMLLRKMGAVQLRGRLCCQVKVRLLPQVSME